VSLSLQSATKTGDGELVTVEAKIEKIPSSKYQQQTIPKLQSSMAKTDHSPQRERPLTMADWFSRHGGRRYSKIFVSQS